MGGGGDDVAGKEDAGAAVGAVDADRDLSVGVAVVQGEADVRVDECGGGVDRGEEACAADGVDVLGGEGVSFEWIRFGAGAQLGGAYVDAGARIGGDEGMSVSCELGGAATMVEVEVGEDDVCDGFGGDAEAGEYANGVGEVMEGVVGLAESVEVLGADAGVDEDDASVGSGDESDLHGKCTAVEVVGVVTTSPCGARNGSEHGATVGVKESGVEKGDGHSCKFGGINDG